VLAFIKIIAPHLTKTGVHLEYVMPMENLDAQQRDFINQLIKIFREDLIRIFIKLANIQFLPNMDNQKRQLYMLNFDADTDIPLLMNMLATPHPTGQQRVIWLFIDEYGLERTMLDAIRQVQFYF
jgi:hypothetical protein